MTLSSASTKASNSLYFNLVRTPEIRYACSPIHLGRMLRFVFKFIQISVDGENIEIVNPFSGQNSVFKFIRVLLWTGS